MAPNTAMAVALAGDAEPPASPDAPALATNAQWFLENQASVQEFFSVMDELFPDEESAGEPAEE